MFAFSRVRIHLHERSITHVVIGVALLGSLVLAPYVTSAQHVGAAPAIDQGTITFVYDVSPPDIDPASNTFNPGDNIERNVDDTLIALDGSSLDRYLPDLATSWSANADKSVWVFHLRQGVRFHTGRCCLTADDVRYSIARTVFAGLGMSYLFARFLTNPLKQIKSRNPI